MGGNGAAFGPMGPALSVRELGLAHMEQAIGTQERLVTRQRRVVETAVANGFDPAPAIELLGTIEENLGKLHAWRQRLLNPRELPAPACPAAAATPAPSRAAARRRSPGADVGVVAALPTGG